MKIPTRPDPRQRGSVLLLVVITMSLLATLAVSAADNSGTLMRNARAERDILRSRLAADSALAYVYRQLDLDGLWTPEEGWLELDGAHFRVERIPGTEQDAPAFVVHGTSGFAEVSLCAEYALITEDVAQIDHAVAFLGGDADFSNVIIHGDLMVVDTEGGVLDYDPFAGEWVERSSGGDPILDVDNVTVYGDLATTSGDALDGVTTVDGEFADAGKIANPTWNLDSYLLPSPDTIVLHDVAQVSGLETDKTVVVVNDPGTTVEFKNCDIGGGVVVWAPSDWPQRGPARNEVTWTQSRFGSSDGGTGAFRHVGMIAPASRLHQANASTPSYGLFYFHELGHMNNAEFYGALWVVNDTGQWNNMEIYYDPSILEQDFQGMTAILTYVELVSVTESHDTPQDLLAGLQDAF